MKGWNNNTLLFDIKDKNCGKMASSSECHW